MKLTITDLAPDEQKILDAYGNFQRVNDLNGLMTQSFEQIQSAANVWWKQKAVDDNIDLLTELAKAPPQKQLDVKAAAMAELAKSDAGAGAVAIP